MSRLHCTELPLPGLQRITRQRLADHRGFLSPIFCSQELAAVGWVKPITQINHTYTVRQGTLRGLHFQHPPHAEMKLVTCLRGEVWDVAVDIRAQSPTFLQWPAERLSFDNGHALLIPEGFAHGFQALSDHAELLYCHSAPYVAAAEGGLNPQDPTLGISWPIPVTELSERDAGHPMLNSYFQGIEQ